MLEDCVQNKFVLFLHSRPGAKRGRKEGLRQDFRLFFQSWVPSHLGPECRSDLERRPGAGGRCCSSGPAKWAKWAKESPPPPPLAPSLKWGNEAQGEQRRTEHLLAWLFLVAKPRSTFLLQEAVPSPPRSVSQPFPGERKEGQTVRPSQGEAPSVSLQASIGPWWPHLQGAEGLGQGDRAAPRPQAASDFPVQTEGSSGIKHQGLLFI